MNIKPIKSKSDYKEAIARLDAIFDAKIGTQESDEADLLGLIIDEFEKYSKKQEGINEIEIESARELDKTTINKIKKMFGEKSDVKTIVNPDMIGGVRIKVDDVVYDASLKKQLSRLKTSLI